MSKARYFTKLDIIAAFNKLRIAPSHEWLTAFATRYRLYEYLVMPFGLANAPASFQNYINNTLHEFLDVFCTAYIDNILVYSKSRSEHRRHVRLVLEKLRKAGLQCDISKCEFYAPKVTYLGTIIDWATPKNVTDVQAFLGFANFYRRFIKAFSTLASLLTALTKKGTPFSWTSACQDAFAALKKAFTTAPILPHFDSKLPVVVKTDASDWVVAGVILQPDPSDPELLCPVAFYSKTMSPVECNYKIYNKELLAIVRAFEQ